MIYITQLIFIKPGKEKIFHEFEDLALPLMEKYNGKLLCRLRPDESAFITYENEKPYEIHFISFKSEEDLNDFMKDDSRLKFMHLKDESVKSMILVKGEKL